MAIHKYWNDIWPLAKNQLWRNKDLNVKNQTIKLLEAIGENIFAVWG